MLGNHFFPNHNLSAAEMVLIPEAFYQLLAARLRISLLKSEHYLPPPKSGLPSSTLVAPNHHVQIIANVVNGLSLRTPWKSTCLVKVIAAHKMLVRRGVPHVLHFGVQKKSTLEIKAHAWLSVSNKMIIGGENAEGFTEISQIVS